MNFLSIKSALIVSCGLICSSAIAQVQLVKDIATASPNMNGSWPYGFVNINGTFYFSAWDSNNGTELWKSDGTTAGTMLVKDISPGLFGSNISQPINVNGILFFKAMDNSHAEELWKSDGTLAGTVMVKDIYPGNGTSNLGNMTLLNNVLYFSANDGVNGVELWRSDGTTAGTYMVKDINPGSNSGTPVSLCVYGGALFFGANDGTNGWELWKSDGTSGGTSLFKDINTGAASSSPANLIDVNGTLFFSAADANGTELWKSSGTPGGTVMVEDIYSGATSSNPGYLTSYSNLVFFRAYTSANGGELWKSDGTALGTTIVKDINPGTGDGVPWGPFVISGNILFFTADDGGGNGELWSSDGSSSGTNMVKDIYPGSTGSYPSYLLDYNGALLFQADDGTNGKEIWRSNGTSGGTIMIKDIFPGAGNASSPYEFTSNGTIALFGATDATNNAELWKTDGTLAGTVMVKNIHNDQPDSYISSLTPAGNKVLFNANDAVNGYELWGTDATPTGTVMVKDIYTGLNSSNPTWLTEKNDTVFFSALNGSSSTLWRSDGTTSGTVLVGGGNQAEKLVSAKGSIFYVAQSGNGKELWKSDGINPGTMVRDICPGGGDGFQNSGPPYELANMNDTVYFPATNCTNGVELWKSDGTNPGTVMVRNIQNPGDSYPRSFTYMNGKVYFAAQTTSGYELWVSNGTNPGTVIVKDIYPGSNGSNPSIEMVVSGNTLYFSATDGISGYELWKSDGTLSGTVMVKDIYPGSASSQPNSLTNINGILYFTASDSLNGFELWRTDGTLAGTYMVKDIYPGEVGSYPVALVNYNDTLFFSAADPLYGLELWVSRGTAQSTVRVSDICPGQGSSNPLLLTPFGNTLLFTANDGIVGTELWKLDMPTALGTSGAVTDALCNGGNSGSVDLTVAGGSAPYTFLWSNAATTEDITGLTAGTYSVLVTDSWNWTATNTFVVNAPTALTVSVSAQTNVTCNGGSNGAVAVAAAGGTPSYTYLWSNSATTSQISNLTSQPYSVTVTDANACTKTLSVTVSQPAVITIAFNKNESACGEPNSIASVITGGNPGYTYLWSTGSTNDSLFNQTQGTYSLTVTDANGCTLSNSVLLNTQVWQPVPICLITVDSTSTKNVLVWEKPVTAGIDRFKIYRNIASTLTYIGFTDYDSLSIFTDTTNGVNPKNTAYEYALGILDSCGVESVKSSTHITIHQATPQFTPPSTFDLSWTDYSGFSFTQYYILRDNNANNNWVKIDSVPYTLANQYTDFGGNHPVPTDSARYIIEAAPPMPCNASTKNPDPMATTIKSTKSNTSEKVTGPTAVAATTDNTSLNIYPNPSSGNFVISGNKYPVQSIRIYTILGELVYSMNEISSSLSLVRVDISFLGTGVYQLQVMTTNGTLNRKIVISE